MTSTLQIDGDGFADAAGRIRGVVDDFTAAAASAANAASHVGHDNLAGRVREFENAWDIRRGKLVTELSEVGAIVDAIAETFNDLDREMAAQLRAAATGTQP